MENKTISKKLADLLEIELAFTILSKYNFYFDSPFLDDLIKFKEKKEKQLNSENEKYKLKNPNEKEISTEIQFTIFI